MASARSASGRACSSWPRSCQMAARLLSKVHLRQRPGRDPLAVAFTAGLKQAAQQIASVVVLARAIDQPHGGIQIAEVVIADVGQAEMAKSGSEVELDGLTVAGQRARLQLGLGLPPAQPPGQVLAERGPAVVDVRALADPAQQLEQAVRACFLRRIWADPRAAAALVSAARRLVAGIPPTVPAALQARTGSAEQAAGGWTAVMSTRGRARGASLPKTLACDTDSRGPSWDHQSAQPMARAPLPRTRPAPDPGRRPPGVKSRNRTARFGEARTAAGASLPRERRRTNRGGGATAQSEERASGVRHLPVVEALPGRAGSRPHAVLPGHKPMAGLQRRAALLTAEAS
jgi:hypothetical protein